MVGNVVELKNDALRGTWIISGITELIKSNDEEVRAAKVQLSSKILLRRSLCHLYPLECESDHGSSGIEIRTKKKLNKKIDQDNEHLSNEQHAMQR